MGGTLLIRNVPEETLWLPQSSTYDAFLERAAASIADAALAKRLLGARLEAYGGYLAIDDLDEARFLSIVSAARDALANAQSDPAIWSYAELLALLRTDPRANESETDTGTIVVSDRDRWTAPRWLFDFVAAHFRLQPEGDLLDVRGRAAELLPMSETMTVRYGDGQGRSAHAPIVWATLAERVNALHAALRSAA